MKGLVEEPAAPTTFEPNWNFDATKALKKSDDISSVHPRFRDQIDFSKVKMADWFHDYSSIETIDFANTSFWNALKKEVTANGAEGLNIWALTIEQIKSLMAMNKKCG